MEFSSQILNELNSQLRDIGGVLNHWLSDHLMRRLSSLSSPDDLFNFVADLRGILGAPGSNVMDGDQIMLDPNSSIGMFIRCCLLAFNQMSFERVPHMKSTQDNKLQNSKKHKKVFAPELALSSNKEHYEQDKKYLVFGL